MSSSPTRVEACVIKWSHINADCFSVPKRERHQSLPDKWCRRSSRHYCFSQSGVGCVCVCVCVCLQFRLRGVHFLNGARWRVCLSHSAAKGDWLITLICVIRGREKPRVDVNLDQLRTPWITSSDIRTFLDPSDNIVQHSMVLFYRQRNNECFWCANHPHWPLHQKHLLIGVRFLVYSLMVYSFVVYSLVVYSLVVYSWEVYSWNWYDRKKTLRDKYHQSVVKEKCKWTLWNSWNSYWQLRRIKMQLG